MLIPQNYVRKTRLTERDETYQERIGRDTAVTMTDPFFPPMPVLFMLHVLLPSELDASSICPTSP